MSVHKKLMEARIKLLNTKLTKTGHNKFAGYYYFELGDFLPTVQTIFNELGLSGYVSYNSDHATLTITDIESSTYININSPMSTAALKGCHEVQNLGAVQTYIRRYLWVTAMEIVEHDALDATTGSIEPEPKVELKEPQWSPEQMAFMQEQANHIIAAVGMDDIDRAHKIFYRSNLDNDEKLAIWSILKPHSSVRSAIKSYDDGLRELEKKGK